MLLLPISWYFCLLDTLIYFLLTYPAFTPSSATAINAAIAGMFAVSAVFGDEAPTSADVLFAALAAFAAPVDVFPLFSDATSVPVEEVSATSSVKSMSSSSPDFPYV
jgi:hypothetical protein